MRFNFSLKTTVICCLLALGMVRASIWQWDRHQEKQTLIATLNATLNREVIDLVELANGEPNWEQESWRRVRFSGQYDFEREFIVRRNRGDNDQAGFHVLTPLKLDNTDSHVLIDRGFIPLGRQERQYRKRYHKPQRVQGYGIIKQSTPTKLFSPRDPEVKPGGEWIDVWKRVNIPEVSKQLPYPKILPIYLEVMRDPQDPLLASKIVKEGSAGRNDVLALTGQKQVENFGMQSPDIDYPTPQFDTTPPPDIHLGYVYEWAFMALLTLGIGFIAQLRRPK